MQAQNSMVNHLMNNLMDLASLESGSFKLNESMFNLDEEISSAFDVVKYKADTKNLRLKSASRKENYYPIFRRMKGD